MYFRRFHVLEHLQYDTKGEGIQSGDSNLGMFHVIMCNVTNMNWSDVDRGFLLGFFACNGSYGGDGQTPQIVVRMGSDQLPVLNYVQSLLPGAVIYGPYTNRGNLYYQWILRGADLAVVVKSGLFDLLEPISPAAFARFEEMRRNYFRDDRSRFNVQRRRKARKGEGLPD